jgi:hypothetical protein
MRKITDCKKAGTFFQKVRANEPPLLYRKAQSFNGRDVRVVNTPQIHSAKSPARFVSSRFDLKKQKTEDLKTEEAR